MISESYFGLVRRKVLFSSYGSAIFKNPLQQDGTEYSVQLWGNNIQLPLEFLIYDSKSVQNSAKGTSTESDRPDFLKKELVSKLIWIYDPAPYILVIAICWPSNGCTKVVDIASSNLALKRDRIYHLRRLINLSKIIEALQGVIGTREMPEYVPILR
ncbi:3252_t:CDS:2 [Rhizophagus irregularis]|nr:3252_t:CDS:2 [Rhizophagus irregularis]